MTHAIRSNAPYAAMMSPIKIRTVRKRTKSIFIISGRRCDSCLRLVKTRELTKPDMHICNRCDHTNGAIPMSIYLETDDQNYVAWGNSP